MMRLPTWRMFKSLWQDTSGLMLPYVTATLFVIIGASLLAVDGARYMSLQTQMQAAADALALAGARELDKKAGAQTRATNAILTSDLVTEAVSGMGVASPAVTVCNTCIIFYSALPVASAGFTGTLATGDSDSKFVAVTVDPKTVPTVFPVNYLPGMAGQTNSFSARAQAIAGNAGQQICKVPPVFICNPWEPIGNTDDAAATTDLISKVQPNSVGVRTQLKVLNDGQTGPGHFGWLVPPDGCKGASCLTEWTSVNSPPECFSAGTVDLNTGAIESAVKAFNLRFDIPNNPSGSGLDSTHSADVNVRKGFVATNSGNWCRASLDTPISPPITNNSRAVAQPEDTSFTALSAGGGSIGNGQWDCATYWSFNHNGVAAPTVRANGTTGVCGSATTTTLSRYDVYAYEINDSRVGDWSRGTGGAGGNNWSPGPPTHPYSNEKGETGAPLCSGSGVSGRRVMDIAVINCEAQSSSITGGATATNIPVAGYASFFINEPVPTTGSASTRNVVGEMIGFTTLTGGGVGVAPTVFNDVQLYR
jgi:Flp pilus assembly protein TadG